ncbi:pantoate--beta-alanine ligase [Bacillus sp. FJAT-27225]|uniref:pantoate--beta-alanine ligase n=1 Tax=Bacillus sp. FJAT-27225 TaxID=1743144 RepID=UPI00080C2D97|nr:pantoate--beta-alanine ligase [Bacillus sp. FJAT-27225]OCA90905.1 pantoate--beta-alanine ligase [Bacillus sp. FJAT-27225]
MKKIEQIVELRKQLTQHKREGRSIGFVPTMGFLHEGHQALIQKARAENDIVVLSIFVNPLQFGPNEDFDAYPRDLERDLTVARNAGVDYVFAPAASEIYPSRPTVKVAVEARTDVLCGKSRPGHFDGVATVLTKLFSIVQPDKAYFGLKDAQQVAVVDGLINDFNFPVQLVAVDTVREEDGLAKSSRNVYLTEEERKEAPALYRALKEGREAFENGEKNPDKVIDIIKGIIERETNGQIDYVEIYRYPSLEPVEKIEGKCIIALAVRFSGARLIDNILLDA